MKKFTLLLVMLLGVLGVKATPTVSSLEMNGGWSYTRAGQVDVAFTEWGHFNVANVGDIDVANYKSITLTYKNLSGRFKMATIGTVGGDANTSIELSEEINSATATYGSVTITFDTDNYASNTYKSTTTIIPRVDLINQDEADASITIESVILTDKDNKTYEMGYSVAWNCAPTYKENKYTFQSWGQVGHDQWKTTHAANTVHRFTVNFGEAVPAGFKFRIYTPDGDDEGDADDETFVDIAAGVTSASVDIDYTYKNIDLVNAGSTYQTINVSSITRTIISTTTTSLWSGDPFDLGNWSSNLNLSAGSKPKAISLLQQGDVLTVNYTVKATGTINFQVCNDGYTKLGDAAGKYAEGQTASATGKLTFAVSDVFDVECAQEEGIIINGTNVYINSVYLTHYENHTALTTIPLKISSNLVATFSSYKNLDFSGLDNITAYYASNVDEVKKEVTMKKVTKAPAGTGLYIVGTEGTYDIPICETEGLDEIPSNALIAVVSASDVAASTSGSFNYILAANKEGEANPGFYKVTTKHNLKKHKAYLQTTDDIAPATSRVVLNFDDEETTGVSEVRDLKAEVRGDYYDLMGRKVAQPTRGLYIVNEKKVIIK